MRIRHVIPVTASLALVLSACGSGSPQSGSSSASEPAPSPTAPPTWPITGLLATEDVSTKPVLVVKIENDPTVRPQYGMEHADMVVEELVEGGMTRFATIFQSDIPDTEIGPVRSVRHVDAAIAEPIADAFVFSGGARRTMNFVQRKLPPTVTIVTEGGAGMHRTTHHAAPHNLYFTPSELVASMADAGTPTQGLFPNHTQEPFTLAAAAASSPVPSGSAVPTESTAPAASPAKTHTKEFDGKTLKTAEAVSVAKFQFSSWSEPRWTWDAASSTFMRSEHKTPFMTHSGVQISASTVIALNVDLMDAGYKDPAGGYVPRTVLTAGGTGVVLNNGIAVPMTWTKEKVDSPFQVFNLDGTELPIPAGKVWMELVPKIDGKIFLTP